MLSRTDAIVPAPCRRPQAKKVSSSSPRRGRGRVINSAADLPLGVITEGRPQTGKDSIAICGGGGQDREGQTLG